MKIHKLFVLEALAKYFHTVHPSKLSLPSPNSSRRASSLKVLLDLLELLHDLALLAAGAELVWVLGGLARVLGLRADVPQLFQPALSV